MNKTRFAAKCLAGTLAATVIAIASMSAPAQAKTDTGWGVAGSGKTVTVFKSDTGWG